MKKPDDNNDHQAEVSPEDQAKADRAVKILYGVMALFVILPFIVLWLK